MNVPVKQSSRQMTPGVGPRLSWAETKPAVAVRIPIPPRFPSGDTVDLVNTMGTVVQSVSYGKVDEGGW